MSSLILSGKVVDCPAINTVKVRVKSIFPHSLYRKVLRLSKCYLVHDEGGRAAVGDSVRFILCKPFSSRKKWKIL